MFTKNHLKRGMHNICIKGMGFIHGQTSLILHVPALINIKKENYVSNQKCNLDKKTIKTFSIKKQKRN